ncbi:LysR family transcriptional regulator [Consotaella aegiceratis]|uniref:LysR family transcriptional regulator n=1 Tax=Consotaella aegiceratis TaxID=3097961 RepID=UPI002F3F22E2
MSGRQKNGEGGTVTVGAKPFTQSFLNRTPLEDIRLLSGDYWDELRVFLAVAKAGSFKRAADLLGTSHPTVSRQVRRLQDVIHAQLIVPSARGVTLTRKGKVLAEKLAALDQSLFSLSSDLKSESQKLEGLVRVSITDGLGLFFLVPLLRHLSGLYPYIQVEIQSPLNVNDLRQNQTDMMVSFAPIASQDVVSRPLGTLHLIPVVTQDYVNRMGWPTASNLSRHLFIQSRLYQGDGPTWLSWNEMVAEGRVAHVCDDSVVYGMMVKAGLGIGLLGNYTMIEPSARPLDLGVHVPIPTFACALKERLNSRPVRVIFDQICENLGRSNPWFGEELVLSAAPSLVDDGIRTMFNLLRPASPPGTVD